MARKQKRMTAEEIKALMPKQLRDPRFVHHHEDGRAIVAQQQADCRANVLPQVTRELVREVLDPRTRDPHAHGPFDEDGDWYRKQDVVPIVMARFGARLHVIDAYFYMVSDKVGRILRKDPFIERTKYQRNAYLYRYVDDEVAQMREDAEQQAEQEQEEAREQAKALEQQADALGIRLEMVGRDYEQARVSANDMARLLNALQAVVRS